MGLKKARVIISNRARRSIKEIFDYIKNREKSTETAHYVRQAIINKCRDLQNFSGYAREPFLEEYPENYQSSIWSYIIILTVREAEVRVLNVVHARKHPDSRKKLD